MRRQHLVRLALMVMTVFGFYFAGSAQASGTVSLRVLDGDGDPLPGAFVALLSPADPDAYAVATTDSSGDVMFTSVADGDYLLRVAAAGHNIEEVALSGFVAASGLSDEIELTSVGSPFTGLGAYGAQVSGVVADGLSGVFYASTTGIPSLYRTSDHGGAWTPVTIATDDSDDGIDAKSTVSSPATSGYPGEIAGLVGSRLYYSRDFGISWDSVQLAGAGGQSQLHWARVGSTSLLLVTNSSSSEIQWAAMPTGSSSTAPTFQTISAANSFKQNATDVVTLWGSGSLPILAVASATDVTLYELDGSSMTRSSAQKISVTSSLFGGSTVPTLIRIGGSGGPTLGSGNAPGDVLLYSHTASSNQGQAIYLRYDSGDTAWEAAPGYTITGNFANTCGANQPGTVGSIAPTGGAGTIGQCWISYSLGSNAVVSQVQNINNNTGVAYDAGYDGSSNNVILSGDGSKGVMKSAQMAGSVPQFPGFPTKAAAGTGSSSGGVAVNGINAAVIRDGVFAPGSSDNLVIAFSFSGGGRVVGSTDGGATFFDVMQNDGQKGANAVDWWQGATDELILIGRPDGGNRLGGTQLSAVFSSTTTLQMFPNTGGTEFEDSSLGGGQQNYPISIAGIDGADAAYVGTGVGSNREGSGGLYFVDLSAGATITRIGTSSNAVAALDYCPTTGSATSLQDVLFVAEAGSSSGRLMRYTGAGDGITTGVSEIPQPMNDVRAACADGIVYGGAAVSSGSGLFKSTDGGQTFSAVTISGTGISTQLQTNLRNIETLAVDVADGNRVVIVTREGDVLLSEDGAASWRVLNDTTGSGRKFGAEIPGDIEFPVALSIGSSPAPSGRAGGPPLRPQPRLTATVTDGGALFGSASGAFNVEQILYVLRIPFGTR